MSEYHTSFKERCKEWGAEDAVYKCANNVKQGMKENSKKYMKSCKGHQWLRG